MIIAGGGIGGLVMALTLHQIGVLFLVIEQASEIRPLGVGINLQPYPTRKLMKLGFTRNNLDSVGLPALKTAVVGLNRQDINATLPGITASYRWLQYAAYRDR